MSLIRGIAFRWGPITGLQWRIGRFVSTPRFYGLALWGLALGWWHIPWEHEQEIKNRLRREQEAGRA